MEGSTVNKAQISPAISQCETLCPVELRLCPVITLLLVVFPSTCAPKRVRGDHHFLISSVGGLKTIPAGSNTEAGKLSVH